MLLLDTCTVIWLASMPSRLSEPAKQALEAESDLCLSDASVWEICLKWQAKKIELPMPPRAWISEQVRTWQLQRIPIEVDHLYRTVELPALHRDPFDRLLAAQVIALDSCIVTPDPAIRQYPVAVIW